MVTDIRVKKSSIFYRKSIEHGKHKRSKERKESSEARWY